MKRCVEILVLFLFLQSFSMNAQTLTNAEKRFLNSRVLSTIEEYESFASLYDEEAEYYFHSLFNRNDQAMVFCDIMGMPSYLEDIPLSEYMKLLRTQSQNTVVTIKDVAKGDILFEDGNWYVPVSFRKSLSYIDQGGYVFSVDDYHKTDFAMTMTLCYNFESDHCYICSISGELVSDYEFPDGRFIIVEDQASSDTRSSIDKAYHSILTVDGKPLTYNEFGQAVLAQGVPSVGDPDVDIYTENKYEGYNYDVIQYNFIPRNGRVRMRYGFAPIAYSVKGLGENVRHRSNAMELVADIGKVVRIDKDTRVTINIGAGLSLSNLSLKYKPKDPKTYSYKYTRRLANGLYKAGVVNYQIAGASEKVRYVDLVIPAYVEYEHTLTKELLLSWNVGLKGYCGLSAVVTDPYTLNATASIDGGEFTKVELVSNERRGTSFIEANTYAKDFVELAVMANVGVDYNVNTEKRIYVSARIGYEYGLNAYRSNTNQYLKNYPVIYGADGDHIAVNSMISGTSMNRSSLWISAGVKFKL